MASVIGQQIMIGEGPPMQNRCVGFGSIVLEVPVDHDFPVDTVVFAVPLPPVRAGDAATAPQARQWPLHPQRFLLRGERCSLQALLLLHQ